MFYGKDITGNKYNRLTVVEKLNIVNKRRLWLCKCDCGNYCKTSSKDLRSGHTKSCGCLLKEASRDRLLKHGKKGTKEYRSWSAMKSRCTNPNFEGYSNYGGVGIKVCDSWLNSFENFLEDMGEAPSLNHSLDRKDGTKGYYKENCRWATPKEQSNNIKTNVAVMHKETGIFYSSISEAAETYGINKFTLSGRLLKNKETNFIKL